MLRLLTLIGLMCLINTPVVAQDLEIGAFYGQRFGGTIGTATFSGSEITDLDVSEGDAWGMTVEFTLPNSWRMELIWDRQDTYLNGNLDGTGKTRLASTTVNNYLFGGNYYFSQDAFRPFLGFHLPSACKLIPMNSRGMTERMPVHSNELTGDDRAEVSSSE